MVATFNTDCNCFPGIFVFILTIEPLNQIVPEDCSRTEPIEGDDNKARITAVLSSKGIGEALIIVKYSAKIIDETGVRF